MVEDEKIKTQVSPFAMKEGEIKTFDGKDGYVSINQIIHRINLGHISEIHFKILELVNEFEFMTSRQIYQILVHRNVDIKSQDKLNNKLEQLIKTKILTRYYFSTEDGKCIYRVYCLEKMGKYFGTDGFRGEANVNLTVEHAFKVGRFLGWYFGKEHKAQIVIGKDTRRSSYMFEYSLVAGLTASGADVYLLHVTTTPSVSYVVRTENFDCGIMISASHNPYYDNGIKLIDCYGEKMPEEILLLVEDYIDGKLHVFDKDWSELPFAHREHIGCTVDYVSGRNRYMGYLISLGIYSFKGVKVGLDCANGSSWNIAKSVFDALGADTYVINAQPNGLNINNNAGSTHIEGLQKFVVEKGLDIGFAYDGDADRCLCVDEKGNVITGDHILYIYGCYMKERGKLLTNTVVTTVMSNFGLYKAFDEQGIGYAKTAVGDKYVYEYMAKNGCRIGGEQSGHIIFSKYASTGDGILTSLKMMEVMLAKKLPMSKLAEPLKIYPQVLENVRVTDKKAAQNDEAVQAAVKAVAEALGDTGRILVRESGTEPVVRVMVEATDHDTCQKYVSQVVETIKSRGYGV